MGEPTKLVMTNQRRVVLEELNRFQDHPSADTVYRRVRKKLPRISLGTVYRALETLAEHGLINRLDSGCGRRRFDGHTDFHYHIRCLDCERLEDIDPGKYPCLKSPPESTDGFVVIGHNLEFFGLCQKCSQAKKSDQTKPNKAAAPA